MNEISAPTLFSQRLASILEEDASTTSSSFPKDLQGETKEGKIDFSGSGTIELSFRVADKRATHGSNRSRAEARAELDVEMGQIMSLPWVKDWLEGKADYLSETSSADFKDTCPTCKGDTTEICPECSGAGKVDCPDWNCSRGQKDCGSCSGKGQLQCSRCYGRATESKPVWVANSAMPGGGSYENRDVTCGGCGGSGYSGRCWSCSGGKVDCTTCRGTAKVDCRRCGACGKITCRDCSGAGEVRFDMLMTPMVKVDVTRVPDDQHETFEFCSTHVPGYLAQNAARRWHNKVPSQDGAKGSFTFRASAYHATAGRRTSEGSAEVWVGHETQAPARTDSYRAELAKPVLGHLESVAFEEMRSYPMGRDALHRLLTGQQVPEDKIAAYDLGSLLTDAMVRAGKSMDRYLRKGEWVYIATFAIFGCLLGILQNSPDFLMAAGGLLESFGLPPLMGIVKPVLFYLPWLVMFISISALLQVRRRRATAIMGQAVKLKGHVWRYAASGLLAIQMVSMGATAFLDTPVSDPFREGICRSNQWINCLGMSIIVPPIALFDQKTAIGEFVQEFWPEWQEDDRRPQGQVIRGSGPLVEGRASGETIPGETRPARKP